MRSVLLVLAVACGGGDAGSDTGVGDSGACGTVPVTTWENFGAGFVTQNCQVCHASTAIDRHGAPDEVTFDSDEAVRAFADEVLDRVVDRGDMPPQGGVPADDKELLTFWLTCP